MRAVSAQSISEKVGSAQRLMERSLPSPTSIRIVCMVPVALCQEGTGQAVRTQRGTRPAGEAATVRIRMVQAGHRIRMDRQEASQVTQGAGPDFQGDPGSQAGPAFQAAADHQVSQEAQEDQEKRTRVSRRARFPRRRKKGHQEDRGQGRQEDQDLDHQDHQGDQEDQASFHRLLGLAGNDRLGEILERLERAQEVQNLEMAKKADREMDERLKLEAKLQVITADDEVAFLEEMEAFELQLRKANVNTWKSWYRYFDQAMAGRAKTWTRELVQYGIGYDLYQAANAEGATERQWWDLYIFMRRELMLRVGVQYEEPAEAAREAWEKVMLPESFRFQEDVDDILDKLTTAHTRMYKTGAFRRGDPDTEMREMQDLRRKVHRGSELRKWLTMRERRPESYHQWVAGVLTYGSTLQRRGRRERVSRFHIGTDAECGEEEQPADEQTEMESDGVRGLRDARQIQGALKSRGLGKPTSPRSLSHVPACTTCKGRHQGAVCPNVYAKNDGNYNAASAERNLSLIHI